MYYIGYDIGSSSVKVALVDAVTGEKLIAIHEPSDEMPIIAFHKEWAEQDPELWWQHVCTATRRAIKEANVDASNITGIGISYQMHGLVVVDKEGKALRNAIIWCDSRAVTIGDQAFTELGEQKCATHLMNSPGNFTVSKLKWVKENEPVIYDKIYKFMLPGDFIAYKLTGEIATTKNGLSEGILWDFKENKVANWLLDYYGIDESLTPNIVTNFTNQGFLHAQASNESGLPIGIPVVYRAGDQSNNALSLNIFKPGEVAATGGTSGVLYAITDQLDSKETSRVNSFVHVNYTNEKPIVGKLLCINGAGIQYRWLRNHSGLDSYENMNRKASKVPVGSDGVVIIPFGNGAERMLNNKNVGTHFLNLNLNKHSHGHLYRAALEGIAFSFVYGMEILKKDNTVINVIRAGNDNLFRSEIFSNTVATLIGHEIEIYNTTGSVGAARAVGLIDGNFEKFGESIIKNDHVMTYMPLKNKEHYLEAYENWKNELELILTKK
ncbi:xylulokinase [Flavobacterium gawalongense]|uniref:Carbohydrate kinase n=1 Tax=Flavobacterium gawalongense TaxID=2594432 RepID=A0A553BSR2_9FLAO|nr:FGGY family carbohydrate kinase [Flavobacterium gawalongense]TRX03690.1 carbohydrate kinase [Flavobacterium gawalongense]TRX08837.1 carbohydrate kinase [Flavobacterium gawalongense]TRX11284.1 carbohydrate kinase [Flavobacterium gawalongense]TRX12255.1 carbohydrate kinase [Flavobacterium gawalongense]TRX30206.1 carbohydrate kinase [Flavobacterium gawalongense]